MLKEILYLYGLNILNLVSLINYNHYPEHFTVLFCLAFIQLQTSKQVEY